MEVAKLLPEVASKYSVIPGIGIGTVQFKGQMVDLTKLTVAEADALVKNGLDVLTVLPPKAKSEEKK